MYRLFFTKAHRSRKLATRSRGLAFRPKVEALEDRCLLSTTKTIFMLDPPDLTPPDPQNKINALTLSGVQGTTLDPQVDPAHPERNSLLTTYSGKMRADWNVQPPMKTIQFVEQNGIVAVTANSGDWMPQSGGGTAFDPGKGPASYGATTVVMGLTVLIAIREWHDPDPMVAPVPFSTTTTSGALALSGPDGMFTFPSTPTFKIVGGAADVNAGLVGHGSVNAAGATANDMASADSTFTLVASGMYRIQLNVDATFDLAVGDNVVHINAKGKLQATAKVLQVTLNDGTKADCNYEQMTHAVGGGPAVAITDPAATIQDGLSTTLVGLKAKLTNPTDGVNEMLAAGTLPPTLMTSGYDPSTGELNIVPVGSNAPIADFITALQGITYQNLATPADTTDRIIQVTANDGTITSDVCTSTIHVDAGGGGGGGGAGGAQGGNHGGLAFFPSSATGLTASATNGLVSDGTSSAAADSPATTTVVIAPPVVPGVSGQSLVSPFATSTSGHAAQRAALDALAIELAQNDGLLE
jgi:hypothetical protein